MNIQWPDWCVDLRSTSNRPTYLNITKGVVAPNTWMWTSQLDFTELLVVMVTGLFVSLCKLAANTSHIPLLPLENIIRVDLKPFASFIGNELGGYHNNVAFSDVTFFSRSPTWTNMHLGGSRCAFIYAQRTYQRHPLHAI